ncbi:MAG: hypothetical protein AAFX09_07750 [Pseudomonadota bacterium]
MGDAKKEPASGGAKRAGFSVGAFVVVLGFVWIVFDNFALALIAGLVFGAGAQAAQSLSKPS